jgi:hypothetical protein
MANLNQFATKVAKKLAFISVPIALYLNANPAKAILNINIFDDGSDLKVVTSGTLSALGNQVADSLYAFRGRDAASRECSPLRTPPTDE